eukprot:1550468-Rhodomonas_salina.3
MCMVPPADGARGCEERGAEVATIVTGTEGSYAVSGTGIAYGAEVSVILYAVSGTELAYGAPRVLCDVRY